MANREIDPFAGLTGGGAGRAPEIPPAASRERERSLAGNSSGAPPLSLAIDTIHRALEELNPELDLLKQKAVEYRVAEAQAKVAHQSAFNRAFLQSEQKTDQRRKAEAEIAVEGLHLEWQVATAKRSGVWLWAGVLKERLGVLSAEAHAHNAEMKALKG